MRIVVDASVVLKWALPETHSAEAEVWRANSTDLTAPDLLLPELGNALWKYVVRDHLSRTEAAELLENLIELPFRLLPSKALVEVALELAASLNLSVYDSLYLATALAEDCELVTADRRLFEIVSASSFAKTARWVGDSPGGHAS